MKLNEMQQKAVDHNVGPALCLAAAGSGKTTVLVNRLVRLHKELKIPANRLCAITFSKAAAMNMQGRVSKLLPGNEMQISTFHSLGKRILTEEVANGNIPELMNGFTVLTSNKWHIKDIMQARRMDGRDGLDLGEEFDLGQIIKDISSAKRNMILPADSYQHFFDTKGTQREAEVLSQIYSIYETDKNRKNQIDFDDMILKPVLLLQNNLKIRRGWGRRFDHVLVDEAQDNNPIQILMYDLLCEEHRNLFLVGDDFQCQPTGNLIKMSDGTEKDIKDIVEGDKVYTWSRDGQYFYSNSKTDRKVSAVAKRNYRGNMFKVDTLFSDLDYRSSECTAEHRWVVRWKDRSTQKYVTYLMKKGENYRIGWCQLFTKQGANHLNQRTRIEEAESVWILSVHDNAGDASIQESLLATKYGLPLVMFKETISNQLYTQERLDWFFSQFDVGQLKERALNCLKEYKRDIRFPFYSPNDSYRKRTTCFEIQACNLISDLMAIPCYNDKKETDSWQEIQVTSRYAIDEEVYSLQVEDHETYISNGQVTHNSIYSFMGAAPENSIYPFDQKWRGTALYKLEENYRSQGNVISLANKLTSHMHNPYDKWLKPTQEVTSEVSVKLYKDPTHEAMRTVQEIATIHQERRCNWKDFAVLYRTNVQSRVLEDFFVRNSIPYVIHGAASFYSRPEVVDMLNMLRVSIAPDRYSHAIKAIINISTETFPFPTRRLGKEFIASLDAYSKRNGCTIHQALTRMDMKPFQKRGVQDFMNFIREIQVADGLVGKLQVIKDRSYLRYLRAEHGISEGDENSSKLDIIDELIQAAAPYKNEHTFLAFVSKMQDMEKKANDPDCDAVHLMTVHKSKGLEWEHVFVIGLNDTILPHCFSGMFVDSQWIPLDVTEERRVAYVAFTRAIDTLHLSCTQEDFKQRPVVPSMFIQEIERVVDEVEVAEDEEVNYDVSENETEPDIEVGF